MDCHAPNDVARAVQAVDDPRNPIRGEAGEQHDEAHVRLPPPRRGLGTLHGFLIGVGREELERARERLDLKKLEQPAQCVPGVGDEIEQR